MFAVCLASRRAAGASLAAILTLAACTVSDNDARLWQHARLVHGQGGSGGDGAAGNGGQGEGGATATTDAATGATTATTGASTSAASGGPMNSGACTLSFTATTVDYGGQYSPRNVGAIWVSDPNGGFIKTLGVWGYNRIYNATHWMAASGANEVDAITSATAYSDESHPVTWDCRDLGGAAVKDGQYTINEEFTSDNSASAFGPPSQFHQITFQKSSMPLTMTPSDASHFTAQKLTFQ